jgi:hypothetical protein
MKSEAAIRKLHDRLDKFMVSGDVKGLSANDPELWSKMLGVWVTLKWVLDIRTSWYQYWGISALRRIARRKK